MWSEFKMKLGTDAGCEYPASELHEDHPQVRILNPKDATKLFFKFLKTQIERYIRNDSSLSNTIQYAVSIPASFEANQRKDLVECLEANGIAVDRQALIDEPNAAFLSYVVNASGTSNPIKIPENYYPNVMVFDFGGGTCDISILEAGFDNHGAYSKNIAISRFEELGGKDLDTLIATDILLPQLLKSTNYKQDDFQTRELNNNILPKLQPVAEKLKHKISNEIALKLETQDLQEIASREDTCSLATTTVVDTKKGSFELNNPAINYQEFARLNGILTNDTHSNTPAKRIEGEVQFKSVLRPVKEALRKASLAKYDIDYLMFIGGSSKNPFIQQAVSEYLKEAEVLIPSDLQTHVSNGSAIHSLILNGFGRNLIQPITSEPIYTITRNGEDEILELLVSAGTPIPQETNKIEKLAPQHEGQKTLEVPICVGNKNKILHNLELRKKDGSGFSRSEKVEVQATISVDKLLMVKARAGDHEVAAEPLSPFINQEMTSEDYVRYRTEREFNIACQQNGGAPPLNALLKLHKTYKELDLDLKAAETGEQLKELFPKRANDNNIGLHYANAGKNDKAIEYYHEALQEGTSAVPAFNLAMLYHRKGDEEQYRETLEQGHEIDPNNTTINYCLGKELKKEGKEDEGTKLLEEAYERWHEQYENGNLNNSDYGWFASCAEALGKKDYARSIRNARPSKSYEQFYNRENLTQSQNQNLLPRK
jgi:molecular chaperone DnaK (HSP70)